MLCLGPLSISPICSMLSSETSSLNSLAIHETCLHVRFFFCVLRHPFSFRRSHALVEAGCVVSLKKIAEDASPATRERIALCFRRLATEPMNRGLIVQQGGLVRPG